MTDVRLSELIDPAAVARLRAAIGEEAPTETPPLADEKADAAPFEVKADTPDVMEHKADPGLGGAQVLEADDETGRVVALVSVTGVEDRVKDTIEPGAYTKTLAAREPIGVWSHDDKTWVARTEHAVELMPGDPFFRDLKTMDGQPWPAKAGAVKVEALFNLETPHGKAAYSDVKFFQGKTGWSIGYRATKATRNPRTGARSIKELDWYEYSPVMVGAASQPMTLSVKSLADAHRVDPDDASGIVDVESLTEDELGRLGELKAAFGLDLEVKARVRTPEGARQYGQPIGSVIIPDVPGGGSVGAKSLKVGMSVDFENPGSGGPGGAKVSVKGKIEKVSRDGNITTITVGGKDHKLVGDSPVKVTDGAPTGGPVSDVELAKMIQSAIANGDKDEVELLRAAAKMKPEDRREALTGKPAGGNPPADADPDSFVPKKGDTVIVSPVGNSNPENGRPAEVVSVEEDGVRVADHVTGKERFVKRSEVHEATGKGADAELAGAGPARTGGTPKEKEDGPARDKHLAKLHQEASDEELNESRELYAAALEEDPADRRTKMILGGIRDEQARRRRVADDAAALVAEQGVVEKDSVRGKQIAAELARIGGKGNKPPASASGSERLLADRKKAAAAERAKMGDSKYTKMDDADLESERASLYGKKDKASMDALRDVLRERRARQIEDGKRDHQVPRTDTRAAATPAGKSKAAEALTGVDSLLESLRGEEGDNGPRGWDDQMDEWNNTVIDLQKDVAAGKDVSADLTALAKDLEDNASTSRDDLLAEAVSELRAAAGGSKAPGAYVRPRPEEEGPGRQTNQSTQSRSEAAGEYAASTRGQLANLERINARDLTELRDRYKEGSETRAKVQAEIDRRKAEKARARDAEADARVKDNQKLAALNKRRRARGQAPLLRLPNEAKSLDLAATSDDDLDALVAADPDVEYDFTPEVKGSSASLDRSPKQNWIEAVGGELPAYVREVARSIEKTGKTLSAAIRIAIGRIKRWAAGGGDVKPDTIAKAQKAVAEWEALKAKAHLKWDSELLEHLEHKGLALVAAMEAAEDLLVAHGYEVKAQVGSSADYIQVDPDTGETVGTATVIPDDDELLAELDAYDDDPAAAVVDADLVPAGVAEAKGYQPYQAGPEVENIADLVARAEALRTNL